MTNANKECTFRIDKVGANIEENDREYTDQAISVDGRFCGRALKTESNQCVTQISRIENVSDVHVLGCSEGRTVPEKCHMSCPKSKGEGRVNKRGENSREKSRSRTKRSKLVLQTHPLHFDVQTTWHIGTGISVDGAKSSTDSAFSTLSSSSTPLNASMPADANGDFYFSSPSMSSDNSKLHDSPSAARKFDSPKRARSPELSRAVRVRQERRRREMDLQETRESLKKQGLGNKRSSRQTFERSTSDAGESSSKHADRLVAPGTKINFNSLGTIRSMEEKFQRRGGSRRSSRRDRNKLARSYESKSTSPTPLTDPDSMRRTKLGTSRSIQNTSSSKQGRRSKSLDKSLLTKQNADHFSLPQTSYTSHNKKASTGSLLNTVLSFPSPPPSNAASSIYGNPETSTSDFADYAVNGTGEPNGLYHQMAENKSADTQKSSADMEAMSSDLKRTPEISRIIPVGEQPMTQDELDRKSDMAVNAVLRDGLPEIPPMEAVTEASLIDWRSVFRVEMMRLRREVNDFRDFCQNQIKLQATVLGKSLNPVSETGNPSTINGLRPQQEHRVEDQLKDLEQNMQLYQKKQNLIDLETELLSQEERLAERQRHLEEYEKEILEVESMLNQRQAICDRRQKALFTLDEELQTLRQELEETREHIHSDGSIPESTSERAKKNWDMVRRNMMDKQQLLETTVQKYRSELAAATSTIAGKDILISRLQNAAMENEEEMNKRDRRIQQLEAKLTLNLSETRQLVERANSNNYISLSGSNGDRAAFREALSAGSVRGSLGGGASASVTFNEGSGGTGSQGESTSQIAPRRDSGGEPSNRPSLSSLAADGAIETSLFNGNNSNASSGGQPYRLAFRNSNAMYRRPSNNAGSDHGEEQYASLKGLGVENGGNYVSGGSSRLGRKRNSVSDNAISRLTLSTPRSDDKFGRGGSSACVIQ